MLSYVVFWRQFNRDKVYNNISTQFNSILLTKGLKQPLTSS